MDGLEIIKPEHHVNVNGELVKRLIHEHVERETGRKVRLVTTTGSSASLHVTVYLHHKEGA